MKGKILILALAVATVMTIAFFNTNTAQAAGGIVTTLHNLSSTNVGGTIHATAGQQNDEICQWCHTPHAANSAFTGAPLWNKASNATAFTMYGTTVAGDTPAATPSGSSKACLSCHDGVDAINSIVLDVDSGNLTSGNNTVAFGATPAGTAVTMPAGATQIGTDLRSVHPISITYTAGKASLVPTTTVFGTSTIAGLLRGGMVECASCHDPHVAIGDSTAQGTVAGDYFLREANSGSALCLSCHAK